MSVLKKSIGTSLAPSFLKEDFLPSCKYIDYLKSLDEIEFRPLPSTYLDAPDRLINHCNTVGITLVPLFVINFFILADNRSIY